MCLEQKNKDLVTVDEELEFAKDLHVAFKNAF